MKKFKARASMERANVIGAQNGILTILLELADSMRNLSTTTTKVNCLGIFYGIRFVV